MKFKFKNKKKSSIANTDKPESQNASLTVNMNNAKNKRKFPEVKLEETYAESASAKRSKKEKKVQPDIEENQSAEIKSENNDVDVQPQSAKKLKKKKKKKNKSAIKENIVKEEQDNDEVISKSNEIESLFVEKSNNDEKTPGAIAEDSAEEKQNISQKTDLTNNKMKKSVSTTPKKHLLPHQIRAEQESRTIFIGNLPVKFNDKKFKKLVGEYGEIESVRIRGGIPECDKISKKVAVNKKMFNKDLQSLIAFVVFKTTSGAQNALNLNGRIFEDRHLRVTLPTEKTSDKNKGIFVGNLPYKITEEDVWKFFEECGEILSVRVIRDNETGLCKGFGYVNFKSEDSVEFALKLNEEKLQDREIRITRLFSTGKLDKMKKKKEMRNNKDNELNKKFKFKKEKTTDNKSGFTRRFKSKTEKNNSDKPGFKFKKKTANKVDLKKKKLAEKLLAKSKKKPVPST